MSKPSHDKWYHRAPWRKLRRAQLGREPFCKFCLARGVVVLADVADHVEPHRGDFNSFVLGELQSLCAPCHNGTKQQIEHRGYSTAIGEDGFPIDPNHPAYR